MRRWGRNDRWWGAGARFLRKGVAPSAGLPQIGPNGRTHGHGSSPIGMQVLRSSCAFGRGNEISEHVSRTTLCRQFEKLEELPIARPRAHVENQRFIFSSLDINREKRNLPRFFNSLCRGSRIVYCDCAPRRFLVSSISRAPLFICVYMQNPCEVMWSWKIMRTGLKCKRARDVYACA